MITFEESGSPFLTRYTRKSKLRTGSSNSNTRQSVIGGSLKVALCNMLVGQLHNSNLESTRMV